MRLIIQSALFITISLTLMRADANGATTIFTDTFGSSTLNGVSTPAGTPGASSTSYDVTSPKNATSSSISSGHLGLGTAATSSGFTEAQARFTSTAVTLGTAGDYIEVIYTFTDTANVFNGNAGNGEGFYFGLYNSGGVAPLNGTTLWNNGIASGNTAQANGGAQNWIGYASSTVYALSSAQNSSIFTRPAQSQGNNLNQELLFAGGSGFAGSVNLRSQTTGTSVPTPVLTPGSQYTMDFKITLTAANTLSFTNILYSGIGLGGSIIATNFASASGANFLTASFDAMAIGYRPATSPGTATTFDINSIQVLAGVAAVPEPASASLLIGGLGVLAVLKGCRRENDRVVRK